MFKYSQMKPVQTIGNIKCFHLCPPFRTAYTKQLTTALVVCRCYSCLVCRTFITMQAFQALNFNFISVVISRLPSGQIWPSCVVCTLFDQHSLWEKLGLNALGRVLAAPSWASTAPVSLIFIFCCTPKGIWDQHLCSALAWNLLQINCIKSDSECMCDALFREKYSCKPNCW